MASNEELDLIKRHGPYDGKSVICVGSTNDYTAQYKKAMNAASFIGVDMREHKCTDIVHNLNAPLVIDPVDVVLCLSVLEHAEYCWLVAHNTSKLVKQGGMLLLSVPFVWRVHGHPDDYWRFTPSAVKFLFPDFNWIEESTYPPKMRLDKHTNETHVQLFYAGIKK